MEVIDKVAAPVFDFMSWIRACKCHENQFKKGIEVSCPWKGCRGPELANKVRTVISEIRNRAFQWADEHPGHASLNEGIQFAFTLAASVRTKFAWVNDMPYALWQVCPIFVESYELIY